MDVERQKITEPGPILHSKKLGALEPQLNIPRQDIRLKLVATEAEAQCNFWVGLTKKGSLSLGDLLNFTDLFEIFQAAARTGITEADPILLSDTSSKRARFVYFTPTPTASEVESYSLDLTQTIHSFAPAAVGIYLSPVLVDYGSNYALLRTILKDMVLRSSCKEYYLLLGEHGVNPMLNSVLELRAQLVQENINLAVFH